MAKKTQVDRFWEVRERDDLGSVQRALSNAVLTPLVCKALDRPSVEVLDWQCQSLKKGMGGGQLFKVSGTARDNGQIQDWSLVLKTLLRETATQCLSEYDWQREALTYRSGLLNGLQGGLEPATCYALEGRSEGEIWMWLEDLSGVPDAPWSLERYALAARHLGQFNGHYLQQSLPDYPWLVRTFERQAMHRDGNIERYRQHKDHPLVGQIIPTERHALLFALWQRREELLAKLYQRLPQTFAHMDSFRANLFSRPSAEGEPTTVAIDWAFTGIGPLGTDVKLLVVHSGYNPAEQIDNSQMEELDRFAFSSYIDGLRDMGWKGDRRRVRYAYTMITAMSTLRWLSLLTDILIDEGKIARVEEIQGRSIDEMIEDRIQRFGFLLDLAEEGLELDRALF